MQISTINDNRLSCIINNTMKEQEINGIKQYLGERGIDKEFKIKCNGGEKYLYDLLHDFYITSRLDAKYRLIKHLEKVNFNYFE